MKVLVATKEKQGDRHDDYSWAVDGELVYVPVDVCDCPGCGCSRGFAGMASSRATTTALVVERMDLGLPDMSNALADSLERQGWLTGERSSDDDELFRLLFQRLLVSASHFPVGSVIERDGHLLRRRAQTKPLEVPGPS